ncbi:hypothetical protein D9758_013629 [Tetrapyrgos nigripes]|uniref:AA9 family lytic polysaccharide monooxygenase n=1 Tax=Tetrapyrgos nigripes TaxID=182062 RepID=A0A8H5CQZ4_9AGAR|nr:hypothetical protein D9758_013629 [Tetrapyrgos nigripes]
MADAQSQGSLMPKVFSCLYNRCRPRPCSPFLFSPPFRLLLPKPTHSFKISNGAPVSMLSASVLAFGLIASLLPAVKAHGQIKGVVANGVWNDGPNIYYDGDSVNSATVTRKMYQASSPAYLNYWDFSDNNKMACESADPAPSSISITAGSDLTIYWEGATSELLNKAGTGDTDGTNPWVHAMGSVTDYITSCNGACSSFTADDAGNAGWTKLATWGLDTSQSISDDLRETMAGKPEEYYPTADQGKGLWGIAKLVEDSSSWTVSIPKGLQSGEYLVRHELAAVHSPKSSGGGPQLYVACIQINIQDGGEDQLPQGTLAGSLYETNGSLANYDVYTDSTVFEDIGPAVWDVVSGLTGSSSSSTSSSSSNNDDSDSNSGSDPQPESSTTATVSTSKTPSTNTNVATQTNTRHLTSTSTSTGTSTKETIAATVAVVSTTPPSAPSSTFSSSSTSTSTSASSTGSATTGRTCKSRKRSPAGQDSKRSLAAMGRHRQTHMKRRLEY